MKITFKKIETLCMEGAMGVSAHAPNRFSNASPSKTFKLSAWKEAWVLVHMHQSDIPLLHLQNHFNPYMEGAMGVRAHASNRYFDAPPSKTMNPLHGSRQGC